MAILHEVGKNALYANKVCHPIFLLPVNPLNTELNPICQ